MPPQQITDPIAFIAREKSFQKRILIVDHYVPEYDKDTGSLSMYEYIQVLIQSGYKVVFFCLIIVFDLCHTPKTYSN